MLVALSDGAEQRLVRDLGRTADLTVTRRCADLQELLAAAIAQVGTLAVTDTETGLDRVAVDRLARCGVRTVLVAGPTEHVRAREIGAYPVDPDADLVAAIREAATLSATPSAPPSAEPAGIEEHREQDAPGDVDAGRVLTVCGPGGAPGRSTIALNLAHEMALAGTEVLLIDADIWSSSLAQMLGVLTDSAGLAAAVRAADRGTLDTEHLGRITPQVFPGLRLLTGLPRSSRWREIGPASLERVLSVARLLSQWVVIDAPVHVAEDDGDYEPMMSAGRNAVLTTVREGADQVVMVGAAEPIGIERLVHTILDTEEVAPRTVVVNRVRSAAAGPRPQDSVREALARFAGVTDAVLIPDDRPGADRALLRAAAWAQVAPKSPARMAVRDLAGQIIGAPAQPTRGRGRLRRGR